MGVGASRPTLMSSMISKGRILAPFLVPALALLALALACSCSGDTSQAAPSEVPPIGQPHRHRSTVEQSTQRQDSSRHRRPADDLSTLRERYESTAEPEEPADGAGARDDRRDRGSLTPPAPSPSSPASPRGFGQHVALALVALGWAFAAVMFLGALTRRGGRLEPARAA